jgi:hypothetical protein
MTEQKISLKKRKQKEFVRKKISKSKNMKANKKGETVMRKMNIYFKFFTYRPGYWPGVDSKV